jgi:hypothetical protein
MDDAAIRRSARRLRYGVIVAALVTLLIYLAGRLELGTGWLRVESRLAASPSPFAPLVGDVTLALLLIALAQLARMLRAVEGGDLFSAAVIRRFRGFILWLFILALFRSLAPILLSIADPSRGDEIALRFDMRDLLTLGLTLILLLIARLLERARRIEDEMREIV